MSCVRLLQHWRAHCFWSRIVYMDFYQLAAFMHLADFFFLFFLLFIGRVSTCPLHPLTCMYPCPQEVLPEECIKILYQILDSTTSACKSLNKATAYNFPSYTLDGGNIALKQNNLFRNQDGDVSSGLRNLFSYWFISQVFLQIYPFIVNIETSKYLRKI